MKIVWYGTASILISTENGSILFDPYLKNLLKGQEPTEKLANRQNAFACQNSVFITHGHFDHLGSIGKLYKDTDCNIYLTKTPYERLLSEGVKKENLHLLSVGDKVDLPGFTVHALKGKHVKYRLYDILTCSFTKRHLLHPIRKLKLSIDFCKYPERGETLFYEVLADGKRIQVMGSADLCNDVDYQTGADLLILPHQGRSDMDKHNERIVNRLKPKRVLLDHYDDSFPPYSADIFVDDFCLKMSKTVPTQKLIEGEEIEI